MTTVPFICSHLSPVIHHYLLLLITHSYTRNRGPLEIYGMFRQYLDGFQWRATKFVAQEMILLSLKTVHQFAFLSNSSPGVHSLWFTHNESKKVSHKSFQAQEMKVSHDLAVEALIAVNDRGLGTTMMMAGSIIKPDALAVSNPSICLSSLPHCWIADSSLVNRSPFSISSFLATIRLCPTLLCTNQGHSLKFHQNLIKISANRDFLLVFRTAQLSADSRRNLVL